VIVTALLVLLLILVAFFALGFSYGGPDFFWLALLIVLVFGSSIKYGVGGIVLGFFYWVILSLVLQNLIRFWQWLRRPPPAIIYPAPPPPPPARQRNAGIHGDAGWAAFPEIYDHDIPLIPRQGGPLSADAHMAQSIYLGRFVDPSAVPERHGPIATYFGKTFPVPMGYAEENNIVTIAPPGSGKGTAAIIPTLLLSRESIFVLDIKGENYFITAPERTRLGQTIITLNPFNLWGSELGLPRPLTHRFNPLQQLRPDQDDFIRRVNSLAASLVPIEQKDPFWSLAARELVACIIAFVCSDPVELKAHNNNLARVIDILSLPLVEDTPPRSRRTFDNDDDSAANGTQGKAGFALLMSQAMASKLPFVRNIASGYTSEKQSTKTTENIRKTAQAQLTFLNEPAIRDFLSRSDFDFADMRRMPMTVYCMLPQDVNITYPNFSRLMVECFFSSFTKKLPRPDDNRVLVILDEQAQLKFMEIIANAPAILRGYKVRIWSIYQNIGQIKQFYDKEWEKFISAAGVVQIMSPNDEDTAKYFSGRTGPQTATDTTTSTSESSSVSVGNSYGPGGGSSSSGSSYSRSTSTNQSHASVPFLSPQELYAMPKDRSLLLVRGLKYPVMVSRDSYMAMGPSFYGATYSPHPVHDEQAFHRFHELMAAAIARPLAGPTDPGLPPAP
jgi:type IV secretion system protein VirD4